MAPANKRDDVGQNRTQKVTHQKKTHHTSAATSGRFDNVHKTAGERVGEVGLGGEGGGKDLTLRLCCGCK